MGACILMAGPPPAVSIKLPGGIDFSSMAMGTQTIPNAMDPFAELMKALQPVIAAAKPVIDIVQLVMSFFDLLIKGFQVLGALLTLLVGPFNPLSALFPVDPVKDADGNPLEPYVPDVGSLLTNLIASLQTVVCGGLKAATLLPQLSIIFTVKDAIMNAILFGDAVMASNNSLLDAFDNLPNPDTGNPIIDALLQCARDNAKTQIENKLDPLTSLATLMGVISILVELIKMPLPAPVVMLAKLMASPPPTGFGLIPFENDQKREEFLQLLDDMAVSGIPLEVPDFSDLSNIGQSLNEMKQNMAPIISIIALIGTVVEKLTKC